MQTKHVPFEEIYDLLAVRIIFEPRNVEEELNDCFDIYVSISKIYKPHPDRLRDWVSHPKANGYQALHVTLMGNNGQWIEVQIRSERMNDVAEQGFAAHWKYKEGGGSEDEGELEKWLKTIKEILDDPQPDAIDFLDTIKLEPVCFRKSSCSLRREVKDNATKLYGTGFCLLTAHRYR